MKPEKKRPRIYVCHTLYHVYVSLLKEMTMYQEDGKADIALSDIFMDFGDLDQRLSRADIFDQVYRLHEVRDRDIPGLMKYKENHNNVLIHLVNRLIYTKKYGKAQDQFFTIDFKQYQDIFVFCDSDAIGYYLNYHHIRYHAVEDGLDCLKHFDAAHQDNEGHFALKAFLARHNLIFIQNGYSKYCIDMEINDDSFIKYRFDKYKIIPRKNMEESLTSDQKRTMLGIFLPDADEIVHRLADCEDCILFLTEAFPNVTSIREQVAKEIIGEHCKGYQVVIKPHPRDDVDYEKLFPECIVVHGKFPIEVLNFIEGIHFKKAISIITSVMSSIRFVEEKINLGPHIWDKYEPEENHILMNQKWDELHPGGGAYIESSK